MTHLDVVIVGAGLSGIGAAVHLQNACPGKTYAILEGRGAIGGTWDLFRYPGVRSDSDMHTLGYNFKPWREPKAIADGPAILSYVTETAAEHDVTQHIRFHHQLTHASWCTESARWSLAVDITEGAAVASATLTCNFLLMCSGYYSYEGGYQPTFDGMESFAGSIVHPQQWPDDLDFEGKRVVVIGSGATAMTLVPAMARTAAQVTMVQRSPTYVVSRPDKDAIANQLRRLLPEKIAYALTRWKNVLFQRYFYNQTRVNPEKVKRQLLDLVRRQLPDAEVDANFTPSYNPWDQRLCLIPNADLFKSIRSGSTRVVTRHIDRFVPEGLRLDDGEVIPADIVVTATGLNLVALGNIGLDVDGKPVQLPETFSYKGMMCSGVPNMIQTFGYINASWTLRADLTAEYACRVLNHLDTLGMRQCTPRVSPADEHMGVRPWIDDFSAGYMQRVMHLFPKQGDRDPWRNTQNYALDKKLLRKAPLEDGSLVFDNPRARASDSEPQVAVDADAAA